ncbi:MAG: PAS domain S-box protein [Bacteroidetes bacterium]|nr:PAS domain S-box protein [Bacteroidota bacterium]
MKKLILVLLKNYRSEILQNWTDKIAGNLSGKLSIDQIESLVGNSLNTFIEVIETSDYYSADEYLIDIYNLFSQANLNLLEISQIFSQARYAILAVVETKGDNDLDMVIILGFLDEIIEQVYARYGMLHQEAQMKELASDRDRLASKLELNQQYLTNIIHSSDSAIMVIDENEKFIAWNSGAEKIFGYTEKEVIGQPATLLLPPETKYSNELERIIREVKETGFIKIVETERMTKTDNLVSVKLSVTKLRSTEGNYRGRSVIIKDFTEVKALQQQVDQSEKLAVIGQLAAGIAHEIGNPLASISSLVQVLQRKAKDDFFYEQLADIKENIDRISKIVRELVDFSRPPSQEKSLTELTDVIKTAIGIVKYDKRVKDVKFRNDLVDDLPMIKIVPDQLLQVFVNIMINALDAIKGKGSIFVKSYFDEHNVYFEITDDGCGMTQDVIDRIFDPFYTTKEVGKGTGLGLSVSYGIVRRSMGEIKVKSKIDEGSTFVIKLPIENEIE